MMAAMRSVKAEGGWGVACTEYCSIHASSDDSPYASESLRAATNLTQRVACRCSVSVTAGHKAARELGCGEVEFKRDRVVV